MREWSAAADQRKVETDKQIAELRKETTETDKQIAETSKETRELREMIRELTAKTDKQIADIGKEIRELTAKTDKQIAETGKEIAALNQHLGSLDNDIGALVEGMLTSDLFEKFHELGYDFDDAIANCTIREKGSRRMLAELDMLMLNGTMALAIEAKTRMTIKDVDQHLNRMKLLHNNPNNLLSGRKLYGAMAGAKMTARSRDYAMKRGFFVLEASGDTVKIEMPVGKPAVW
jgi:predicted RNase H-like nuclease (RuvC/YqgF family)